MTDMTDMTSALAAADQPGATFRALEALAAETIGARLFTLMEMDRARGVARRTYSNMPEVYPVSGEKPLERNAWTEQVEDRRETFVANSLAEIAAVFPDHELIASLGCESCLNLPVVIAGKVVGTINCLHGPAHYTPERVERAGSLKLPGAAAFLMAARISNGA